MDFDRLDRLARSLATAGSRRWLLGILAAAPALGELLDVLDPGETAAKERRRRRKQRHDRRKKPGNRKRHKPKTCKPESVAQTCAGKCGSVINNCKASVDCGSCDCSPACADCFTCQGAAGAPGACIPVASGTPCGASVTCDSGTLFPRGSCDGDGNCLSSLEVPCDPYTRCDGNACATSCTTNDDCVTGSNCNAGACVEDLPDGETCASNGQCGSGFCVDGVCCESACGAVCFACDVPGSLGACVADQGEACGSDGQVCQADGSCACDASSCSNPTPICTGGTCVVCTVDAECGADSLCVDGECHACDVSCTAGNHTCANTALQTAVAAGGTIYVCPGRYTGTLTLAQNVTLIGAGQGEDSAVDTVLDALANGSVVTNPAGVTASLQQVWITNGRGDGGAGVQNLGTLTLNDCTISGNENPENHGGGVYTSPSGFLEMIGCTVHNNHSNPSSGRGGGLAVNGPATLTNCTIGPNNTAGNNGGGITLLGSLTLNGCIISGNSSSFGGGIYNNFGLVTLNGGSVTGNSASNTGDDIFNGGTVVNNDATIGECTDRSFGCGCPGGNVCP